MNALDHFSRLETEHLMKLSSNPSYKAAQAALKKATKAIQLTTRAKKFVNFIHKGLIFSQADTAFGKIVDLFPKYGNKPENVANMPWIDGLDKTIKAKNSPGSNGLFSVPKPAATTWHPASAEQAEYDFIGNVNRQAIDFREGSNTYTDDQGKTYQAIYEKDGIKASIPELMRKHKNKLIATTNIPKKDIIVRGALESALEFFGKTVGLKTKLIEGRKGGYDTDIEYQQFLKQKGEDGFAVDVVYDDDAEGAAAWAYPFRYKVPPTKEQLEQYGLTERMTSIMGYGRSMGTKITDMLGIAQKAFPFHGSNITDFVSQLLYTPFEAIGPGNEGNMSFLASSAGLLTHLRAFADVQAMVKNVFLHEMGHMFFLDHTMSHAAEVEGYGDQGNPSGNPTAIRSIMSYDAPFVDKYLKGDLRGFQAMLKPLPSISELPKVKNNPMGKFNGGLMPGFANGGAVPGFGSQGMPALLHGGEYVVNSSAVKNIGFAALQAMNDMRFNTPKAPAYSGPVQPQQNSTSSVNIYVDNFIGEKQWFESMMKDYNINVSPQNQKNAGLQNRTISTYNGLNRGL